MRPCLCAVRPFVLTFTGSLDEELRWIQTKGREMSEMRDLDHSHDVDDLDHSDLFQNLSLRCPSPFTCCPTLRPPLLQHAPKSTNGRYLRRDWLHGMCGNRTYPWAWSWLVHQQESKHWVITASKSKLALYRLKTSRILGGKRVNIPRP